MDLIAHFKQDFSELEAILAGDAGDKGAFHVNVNLVIRDSWIERTTEVGDRKLEIRSQSDNSSWLKAESDLSQDR